MVLLRRMRMMRTMRTMIMTVMLTMKIKTIMMMAVMMIVTKIIIMMMTIMIIRIMILTMIIGCGIKISIVEKTKIKRKRKQPTSQPVASARWESTCVSEGLAVIVSPTEQSFYTRSL